MGPTFDDAVALLERTPRALGILLGGGLDEEWTHAAEGEGTWSPFDVVGHLVHGEETDWIPRVRIILESGPARPFEPFDRTAMLERFRGRPLEELLEEFARLRGLNLGVLRSLDLSPEKLVLKGTHPALGAVTLGQLVAAWAVHDLDHLAQVARVMARRFAGDVGPWSEYLPILSR